jgi:hypothetical protein
MSKYEIKDAVMLKECMRIIAEINAKYEYVERMLHSVPEDIKEAIEFIQAMVEKNV